MASKRKPELNPKYHPEGFKERTRWLTNVKKAAIPKIWVTSFEFDTERSSKSVIMALLEEESFHSNMESTHAGAIKLVGPKDELPSHVPGQTKSPTARGLTPDEQRRLADERALVSDFKQMKLEREAQKNWDLFYKRNCTHFFKDRHWTTREFEELKACREFESQRLVLLEAGCGVGNCIFPLLEEDRNIFVYACDFSPRAVEFVKQNPLYVPERCCAFQCDLTKDDLRENVPEGSVDVVTLIFVLSAVHPDKMKLVLENISRVLKPRGTVLFRDYGLHDHAMLRFKAASKLGENFYVRQDGTRSYFFSKEFLGELFEEAGLHPVANDYVLRETVNKKEGLCVPRVFLQSKFTKPPANHRADDG